MLLFLYPALAVLGIAVVFICLSIWPPIGLLNYWYGLEDNLDYNLWPIIFGRVLFYIGICAAILFTILAIRELSAAQTIGAEPFDLYDLVFVFFSCLYLMAVIYGVFRMSTLRR